MHRTRVVDQRSPLAGGPSPSWARVIADTIKLSRERRRLYRVERGADRRAPRLWIPLVCGLVVFGCGLLVKGAFGSADPAPEAAPSPSRTPTAQSGTADPAVVSSRLPGGTSRATPSRTASAARAAAGAEIASRPDTDVSPAAASVLADGKIDGRLLIVLAALASADLLTAVEVPQTGTGGPADVANLEMGVVDVDRVLGWLEDQRRLRPDRVELRHEASVSYVLLVYDTPEPPGLFPS
jgi:hypothetical protein